MLLDSLLDKPEAQNDVPAFSVTAVRQSIGKSVRTKQGHYVEWDHEKTGSMLFEHPADPFELKNLANDARYAKVVEEMKTLLKRIPTELK